MEKVVKEDEKEPKLNQNENDYTEQYKGLIMLRKGKLEEKEIWFATVGKMLVSDGAFGTKEQQQQRPKGRPKCQRESRER